MARLTRLCPANIPQHIIQRGNNRQICFANEQDFEAYISWLKVYAKKYDVEAHACLKRKLIRRTINKGIVLG